jgi:large subunit ribosomal protein L16
MIKIRNPNKLKYKKYNKSFCFKYMNIKQEPEKMHSGFFYAIRAKQSGFLSINQIQTCYKTLAKSIKIAGKKKRKNKIKLFVNIDKPLTSKSLGVRMGKGKGSLKYWGCAVRKGQLLFQIKKKVKIKSVTKGLKQTSIRLPLDTQIESYKKKLIYA